MPTVTVNTTATTYPIRLGCALLKSPEILTDLARVTAGRRCLIISDSNVAPLYADSWTQRFAAAGADVRGCHVFPAGEAAKTLDTVAAGYSAAVAADLDRKSVIIALGGGVVGDLAGFIAATYMRGIGLVQIPTSLLAMVDSSVGGKVGVDLPEGKNLVGAFYQPSLVLADLSCLCTLPNRELKCGLAEIVKYGVILDATLFAQLTAEARTLALAPTPEQLVTIVTRCCQIKADVVATDERETSGHRALLNYGHTFGHALEMLTGFTTLNHGEAVAIGMGMAADLAVAAGLAAPDTAAQQDELLTQLGLPLRFADSKLTPAQVIAAMQHDKKTVSGKLRLVLPRAIGKVEIFDNIAEPLIAKAIRGRCG